MSCNAVARKGGAQWLKHPRVALPTSAQQDREVQRSECAEDGDHRADNGHNGARCLFLRHGSFRSPREQLWSGSDRQRSAGWSKQEGRLLAGHPSCVSPMPPKVPDLCTTTSLECIRTLD